MKLLWRVIGLSGVLLTTACASVPMAAPDEDARGKTFQAPDSAHAAFYFYRSGIIGGVAAFTVTLGQRTIGQLAINNYMRAEVEPGRQDVRCTSSENSASLIVDASPGAIYYIEVTSRPGIVSGPRCGLLESQSVPGRAAVMGATRAAEIR